MDEEKEVKEVKEEPKPAKEIKVKASFLYMLFAVIALALFVIAKICAHFGVAEPAFYGVFAIIIYCLPFVGMVLSYIGAKKLTPEFWANLGVLALSLAFYI